MFPLTSKPKFDAAFRMSGRDLRKLMRLHKVTIAALAKRMDITQKRIRARLRDESQMSGYLAVDWFECITGAPTPRMRAAMRQLRVESEENCDWEVFQLRDRRMPAKKFELCMSQRDTERSVI